MLFYILLLHILIFYVLCINKQPKIKRENEDEREGGRELPCVFNFQAICLNVEDRYVSPLRDRYRA